MDKLDPDAVNLAKAIRQQESGGNFALKGKSGEYGGYQFTNDTWNATAPKYGITVPLNKATPQQQNAVAYNRIKEWKDSGKNVTQIASMWNAGEGEPDAYTGKFSTGKSSIGVNNFGADYNVPNYAKAVSNNYLKLKGQGSTQTSIDNAGQQETGTQKAAGILGSIFPGKQIGEAASTSSVRHDIATDKLGIQYPDYSRLSPAAKAKLQAEGVPITKEAQMAENEKNVKGPTTGQVLGDVASAGLLIGGAPGIGAAGSVAGRIGTAALETGAYNAAQSTAGGETNPGTILEKGIEGGALGAATAGVFEAAGPALGGVKKLLGGAAQKTDADILNMVKNPNVTHEEIASLSPTERSRYNELKTDEINDTVTQAKSARDTTIQQETERINTENDALKQQLDATKNKQAVELKPLAIQALKDNSDLFMEKVENGFSEGTNLKTKISATELENAVNEIKDPIQKSLAIKQFGLDDLISRNPETGNITYKNTTLGDIWKNSKDLRQTIGAGAKTGGRVFSPEEMATVQNTKILTDLLEKNGMDLTEANQFWTQWTKMRKRILTEVKPFDVEGVSKMPVESTIERAATPTAKGFTNAKNFISQLEQETGLPTGSITADTEKIIGQIDKNKLAKADLQNIKNQINQQIAADKIVADKNLDAQKFSVQQIVDKKSRLNRIVLRVLKAAGLVGLGYEGVKHIL